MNIFNQCEDSLLATPLILDLAILAELLTRVTVRPPSLPSLPPRSPDVLTSFSSFLSHLQYRASPTPESPSTSEEPFQPLYPVLSLLSYMVSPTSLFFVSSLPRASQIPTNALSFLSLSQLKAPIVKEGTAVVNSLARQRAGLEQFLKACLGLENGTDLLLESRVW